MAEVEVERELRALGQVLDASPPSSGLVAAVMERVATEPVPTRSGATIAAHAVVSWMRARLRWLAGALLALVGAGVVLSPVGAEVAEWFGIGGVVVRTAPDSSPVTSPEPEVPEAPGDLRLAEAAELAGFDPALPAELGPPARVAVVDDGTVVSMSWRDAAAGTLRLDQLEVELAAHWWKTAIEATPVHVGSHDALWIGRPHELVVLDEAGHESTLPPRLAAQTLVWVDGDRTFRLEGDLDLERAVRIAESVR